MTVDPLRAPTSTTRRTKVLLVDDDPAFRRLGTLALEEAGIEHVTAGTASDALAALKGAGDEPFDLILLDVELPGMKGLDLVKLLRNSGRDIPVVLVTVRDDVHDKIRALDLGADDYVVKPCSFEELLSRLVAVLRRSRSPDRVCVGTLEIDRQLRRVRSDGVPVELTPREFELLALLVEARGRVVSKTELLERVWRLQSEPNTNFLQVHFSRLRQKLGPLDSMRIETVYGVGYRLVGEGVDTEGGSLMAP
ncbi:MAG TPA: response regulator transcription factor [Planctomycetota bacterium]